jgi:hypothetical protein
VPLPVIGRSGAVIQKMMVKKTRRKKEEMERELRNKNLDQMKEIRNLKRRMEKRTWENKNQRGKK